MMRPGITVLKKPHTMWQATTINKMISDTSVATLLEPTVCMDKSAALIPIVGETKTCVLVVNVEECEGTDVLKSGCVVIVGVVPNVVSEE